MGGIALTGGGAGMAADGTGGIDLSVVFGVDMGGAGMPGAGGMDFSALTGGGAGMAGGMDFSALTGGTKIKTLNKRVSNYKQQPGIYCFHIFEEEGATRCQKGTRLPHVGTLQKDFAEMEPNVDFLTTRILTQF